MGLESDAVQHRCMARVRGQKGSLSERSQMTGRVPARKFIYR